jgi:hypothetical protein
VVGGSVCASPKIPFLVTLYGVYSYFSFQKNPAITAQKFDYIVVSKYIPSWDIFGPNRWKSLGASSGHYRLDDRGSKSSIHGRSWTFFSLSPCPDRIWGPPSLLFRRYRGVFPWDQNGRGVKLTTYLHLVPSSRMRGAILPLLQYVFMAWCLIKHRDNFNLPNLIRMYHLLQLEKCYFTISDKSRYYTNRLRRCDID